MRAGVGGVRVAHNAVMNALDGIRIFEMACVP